MNFKTELIKTIQTDCVANWHQTAPEVKQTDFMGLVEKQHLQNYLLWHEEDKARDPKADDKQIAQVKRNIDQLNQRRNDLIEAVDSRIYELLIENEIVMDPGSQMNSETPGNIIDRCSIMALKIYHMAEQTRRQDVDKQHIDSTKEKVLRLTEQRDDLSDCLFDLYEDISNGKRHFKVYHQYKMYNDPTLNPEIYKK